jgi:ATP-binding cassette, subfamily C (CFTR/MRP), member 1
MYERRVAQLNCQIRMGLVGVIYNRCLTIKAGVLDDSAAVTLMSSDTEDAANSGALFHQLWSEVLELCIGMYMLARELGWVCISPLLVVLCMVLVPHSGIRMIALTSDRHLQGSQLHH